MFYSRCGISAPISVQFAIFHHCYKCAIAVNFHLFRVRIAKEIVFVYNHYKASFSIFGAVLLPYVLHLYRFQILPFFPFLWCALRQAHRVPAYFHSTEKLVKFTYSFFKEHTHGTFARCSIFYAASLRGRSPFPHRLRLLYHIYIYESIVFLLIFCPFFYYLYKCNLYSCPMTDRRSYFNKCRINFTFYAYLYITINIYAVFYNIYKRFNAINNAFFAKMRFKHAYFF